MRNFLYPALVSLCVLLMLDSCTTSRMQCPGFAAKHVSHKGGGHALAFHHHAKKDKAKSETASKATNNKSNPTGGLALGGGGKDKGVEIAIPKAFVPKVTDEDVAEANEILKKESGSKVSLVKERDKLYVKAKSKKALTQYIMKQMKHPKATAAAGGGSGMALASGIIGIIAFVFAFGPYISFLAIVLGIVAVILGIFSLGSSNSTWAVIGIILGALAIAISFLFIFLIFLGKIF